MSSPILKKLTLGDGTYTQRLSWSRHRLVHRERACFLFLGDAQGVTLAIAWVISPHLGYLVQSRTASSKCNLQMQLTKIRRRCSTWRPVARGDGRPVYELDGPDGFPGRFCGLWGTAQQQRTVRTVCITFCQGEGREFESRHPLQKKVHVSGPLRAADLLLWPA